MAFKMRGNPFKRQEPGMQEQGMGEQFTEESQGSIETEGLSSDEVVEALNTITIPLEEEVPMEEITIDDDTYNILAEFFMNIGYEFSEESTEGEGEVMESEGGGEEMMEGGGEEMMEGEEVPIEYRKINK